MRVVTSTLPFLDIDGYAGCVAYAELLRLQGKDAVAATSTHFNASVPPLVQDLDVPFETNYMPSPADTFVLVDISNPDYFDNMVNLEMVVEVIDHHPGHEKFWQEKLGAKARIKFVGAASTLVYERWFKAGLLDKINRDSAKLLACGILDNTLNFGAKITTDRDKAAYADLAKWAALPKDWPKQYFTACQQAALSDVRQAIEDDTKTPKYPSLPHNTSVGQLALWDAQDFISANKDVVREILAAKTLPWYMNFVDISTGRSIFFCEDPDMQQWLISTLDVTFEGDTATANRMWLRKEIMKQAIEKENT